MSDGYYSRGKQLLADEKANKQAQTVVPQVLGDDELTAKSKAVKDILETLNPLLKSREVQQQHIGALTKALEDYGVLLAGLTDSFNQLKAQLEQVVQAKNVNAAEEKAVLDKLMQIL